MILQVGDWKKISEIVAAADLETRSLFWMDAPFGNE